MVLVPATRRANKSPLHCPLADSHLLRYLHLQLTLTNCKTSRQARDFDEALFELIEDLDETGCVMCCSAGSPEMYKKGKLKKSKGRSGELVHEDGVVLDHTYTLLGAVDNVAGSGFDLIELRNPWGTGEWKGKWCDGSDMWQKHPQVKKILRPEFRDDGRFWISKEDFASNFETISVCMSERMLAQQKLTLELARQKALANYTRKPAQSMAPEFAEQQFITQEEARRLCEFKHTKWAGYVELPSSDDPMEEVGVIMLKVGGELVSEGVPANWVAYLYNPPPKKQREKKKERAKAKGRFMSAHPPSDWPQLARSFSTVTKVVDGFATADSKHILGRRSLHARPNIVIRHRQGSMLLSRCAPPRLPPLSAALNQRPLSRSSLWMRPTTLKASASAPMLRW